MKNVISKHTVKEVEINGFLIKEVVATVHNDGCIQTEEGLVKVAEESLSEVPQAVVELDGGCYPLKSFSFEKACEWASDCPQDLANLIFD